MTSNPIYKEDYQPSNYRRYDTIHIHSELSSQILYLNFWSKSEYLGESDAKVLIYFENIIVF